MGIYEVLVRVFYECKALVIPMAITAALTLAAALILGGLGKKLWPDSPLFGWLGVFFELRGYAVFRMAAAWVKLCLIPIFVFSAMELDIAHYVMLIVAMIVFCVDYISPLTILPNLLGEALELLALLIANILLSYIKDYQPGFIFVIFYLFLSVFIVAYEYYLFMSEIRTISQERSADLGKIEPEEE